MAVQNFTCYADASAYVVDSAPGTNFSSEQYLTVLWQKKISYVHFDIPPEVKKRRVVDMYFYVRAYDIKGKREVTLWVSSITNPFTESGVTYATKPRYGGGCTAYLKFNGNGVWANAGAAPDEKTKDLLNGVALYIPGGGGTDEQQTFLFYSSRASGSRPYVVLKTEEQTPIPQSLFPESLFLNRGVQNTFKWEVGYNEMGALAPVGQSAARIKWRERGETEEHLLEFSIAASQVVIPEGTFPHGNIEWALQITSDANVVGDWSDWVEFTTIDSIPISPTGLSPVNVSIYAEDATTFAWAHSTTTGSEQKGFDLQYSGDSGQNWTALADHVISKVSAYTIPANTLPTGNILWRVRTYNTDNEPGAWSENAALLVRGAPPAPVISGVDSKPRPTVSWQSADQQAYQVRTGSYDSGACFGVAKSYKIPIYLPDGTAVIQVRVQNLFGLWSPWASASTTIANVLGDEITLRTARRPNAAQLLWDGGFPKYYVYRDGKLIAKTTATDYLDNAAVGPHKYQIRGVTAEDYYTLSREVVEVTKCRCAVIAEYGVFDWIPLKYKQGENPLHSFDTQAMVQYNYYVGFDRPVADVAPFRTSKHSFSFSVLDRRDSDSLRTMVGKPVLFKDHHQRLVTGILDSISTGTGMWDEADFTITEAVVEGVIAYD